MKKFTNSLANIKIASPCSANWDEMLGDERRRYCSECKLNVYNLSEMTQIEAENFLINSEGRVCVKFYRRVDGTVLTQDCPVGWERLKRKTSRTVTAIFALIAGFFGGSMVFNALSFDSSDLMKKVAPVPDAKNEAFAIEGKISNLNEIKLHTKKSKSADKINQPSQMVLGRVENFRKMEDVPVDFWVK